MKVDKNVERLKKSIQDWAVQEIPYFFEEAHGR